MTELNQLGDKLVDSIECNLKELIRIWDYVGYNETERHERFHHFVGKFQLVMNEIVKEEDESRLAMEQKIESLRRQIAELCQQLEQPVYLPDRGLTSNDLINLLTEKHCELANQKLIRCKQYATLRQNVLHYQKLFDNSKSLLEKVMSKDFEVQFPPMQHFMSQMHETNENSTEDGTFEFKASDIDTVKNIPAQRLIESLTEVERKLHEIYEPIAAQYNSLCEDIARIAVDIVYQPQSEKEVEILKSLNLHHLCKNINLTSTPGVVRKASFMHNGVTQDHQKDSVGNNVNNVVTNGHLVGNDNKQYQEPVVSEEILGWLAEWRLKLVKEKARLVGTCEELRTYLVTMWKRLDKPEAEQQAFLSLHSGYKPDVLEALHEEMDRCQQLKWENMQAYIDRLQSEAVRLAKLCCLNPDELIQLPNRFDNTNDPETSVNYLETKLDELNQTYELYRPVFESIAAYESNWQQLLDVEIKLKDPAILSNRGGILLKTEKEKKRLLKEIERSEKEAIQAVEFYESKSGGSQFMLGGGKTFIEYMTERWTSYKTNKESCRSRRSILPTPSQQQSRPTSANLSTPT